MGNITWSSPSTPPTQEAYRFQVKVDQNCSTINLVVYSDIIITIRNFTSYVFISTTNSTPIDSTAIYATIASVGVFILVIVAILFVIIYYRIQRARHRVPPFFKTRTNSSAQGLSFFKSKSPLSDSSPYTLGVRDDESSNTSSDQTSSSPVNNRLLSGHYKVNEPPVNTTIEELLSSYDNRSTSSSSGSSGLTDHVISTNPGSFRTIIRETNDHEHLSTINENVPWMNNHNNNNNHQQQNYLNGLKHQIVSDDAMDIISESHEVENKVKKTTNACSFCLNSKSYSINNVCSHSCSFLLSSIPTQTLLSSSYLSPGSSTAFVAYQQATATATTSTDEVGCNRSCSTDYARFSPIASTRC